MVETPLPVDVPAQPLVVLGTLMYAILTFRWHQHISWRQLGIIVSLAGVGLVIGMVLMGLGIW